MVRKIQSFKQVEFDHFKNEAGLNSHIADEHFVEKSCCEAIGGLE